MFQKHNIKTSVFYLMQFGKLYCHNIGYLVVCALPQIAINNRLRDIGRIHGNMVLPRDNDDSIYN